MLEESSGILASDSTGLPEPAQKPLPATIPLTLLQYRALNNAIDEAAENQKKLDQTNKDIDEILAGIASLHGVDKGDLTTAYVYNRMEFIKP